MPSRGGRPDRVSLPYFGSVSVAGSALRHPRAAVIEPDRDLLAVMLETLADHGYVATGFSDPGLAESVLRHCRFDVVVSDAAPALGIWRRDPQLGRWTALVLLEPPGHELDLDRPAGAQVCLRPILRQRFVSVIEDALSIHHRSVETQPEIAIPDAEPLAAC